MKLVTAIIKPFKLDEVREALSAIGLDTLDQLRCARFVDIGDDDFRAFAGEFECRSLSDAAPCAGDDGYLVFESHASPFSWLLP